MSHLYFNTKYKARFISWYNKKYNHKSLWEFLNTNHIPQFREFWNNNVVWYHLSSNPNTDLYIINAIEKLYRPWNNGSLCRNPHITEEYFLENKTYLLSCHYISENPNISIEFLKKHGLFYDYLYSANASITWNYVVAHPEIKWDYEFMSANPNINIKIVLSNIHLPWDFFTLSRNRGIKWEDIIANPQLDWNKSQVSENPNITIQIVLDNLNYGWSFPVLTRNPGITWQDILANPQIPWDYEIASENPNITFEDIEADSRLQITECISTNVFLYDDTVFLKKYTKETTERKSLIKSIGVVAFHKIFCIDIINMIDKYINYV
jgi:hypothetical protein